MQGYKVSEVHSKGVGVMQGCKSIGGALKRGWGDAGLL